MKIPSSSESRFSNRHRQEGTAVIVMLAILSIMLLYIAATTRSLNSLNQELMLLEQRQVRRLDALSATNTAALAVRAAETNAPALAPPAQE